MPAANSRPKKSREKSQPMRVRLLGKGGGKNGGRSGGKKGALWELARRDQDIARALDTYGAPADRSMPADFTTLARIITGQQISRHAASAVWRGMEAAGFSEVEAVAAASIEGLRGVGLSARKAEYIQNLAHAIMTGELDLPSLARIPGEEAAATLTALPGIGDWTADNYRLFALLDMDAWPYNDLALQGGMKIVKGLEVRPDGKAMQAMGEDWRPWRGAGALMLWHVYGKHTRDASPRSVANI